MWTILSSSPDKTGVVGEVGPCPLCWTSVRWVASPTPGSDLQPTHSSPVSSGHGTGVLPFTGSGPRVPTTTTPSRYDVCGRGRGHRRETTSTRRKRPPLGWATVADVRYHPQFDPEGRSRRWVGVSGVSWGFRDEGGERLAGVGWYRTQEWDGCEGGSLVDDSYVGVPTRTSTVSHSTVSRHGLPVRSRHGCGLGG